MRWKFIWGLVLMVVVTATMFGLGIGGMFGSSSKSLAENSQNIVLKPFVGTVVGQSPEINERLWYGTYRKSSFLLVSKGGKHRLVLRAIETLMGIPGGVGYSMIPRSQVPDLHSRLADSSPEVAEWLARVEALLDGP